MKSVLFSVPLIESALDGFDSKVQRGNISDWCQFITHKLAERFVASLQSDLKHHRRGTAKHVMQVLTTSEISDGVANARQLRKQTKDVTRFSPPHQQHQQPPRGPHTPAKRRLALPPSPARKHARTAPPPPVSDLYAVAGAAIDAQEPEKSVIAHKHANAEAVIARAQEQERVAIAHNHTQSQLMRAQLQLAKARHDDPVSLLAQLLTTSSQNQ
jgi:hypothetical protein